MASYVVDASVGIKWFIPEIYQQEAELFLHKDHELLIPDLFYAEIANILWKRVRSREIKNEIAQAALETLHSFKLQVSSCESLFKSAFDIATTTNCSVYDSIYVALAIRKNTSLITADRRLFNSLNRGAFAKRLLLLGNETV